MATNNRLEHIIREQCRSLGLDLATLGHIAQVEQSALDSPQNLSHEERLSISRVLRIDLASFDETEDDDPERLPPLTTLLRSAENYASKRSAWASIIEAAHVAEQAVRLEAWLGRPSRLRDLRERVPPCGTYTSPLHKEAKQLASQTRKIFSLGRRPISSMRDLCWRMGVLVIETVLPSGIKAFALCDEYHGPTLVLNADIEHAFSLRYTIAHELCHILYDRHDLTPLAVLDPPEFGAHKPPKEVRADAFGIHFLAPEATVKRLWKAGNTRSHEERIRLIMDKYGISLTAARNACMNWGLISPADVERLAFVDPTPKPEVISSERDPTDSDEFSTVRRVRRGRFLQLVLTAWEQSVISRSLALELLQVDGNVFEERASSWTKALRRSERGAVRAE